VLTHAQPQDRVWPWCRCASIAPTRTTCPGVPHTRALALACLAYPCPDTTDQPPRPQSPPPKGRPGRSRRLILSCPFHTSRSRLASRCQNVENTARHTLPGSLELFGRPGGDLPISAVRAAPEDTRTRG
jgi:hypothetical protein